MLKLLLGAFGTGKTTRLFREIAADIEAGIPSFLVVPEQNTVSVEAMAADRLPPSAPLVFEVTNFTRLADTVFRRVGGVAARYADEGTATLLTRDAIAEVAPLLHDRRRPDAGRVGEVMRAIRECKASAVTPEALAKAAEATEAEPQLSRKLRDLSLLLSAFEATMESHECALPIDGLALLADVLATKAPLAGAHFYFDGFTSFTALQRAVLSGLLRSGEVTVSLPMPERRAADRSLAYAELCRTHTDLIHLAARVGAEVVTETLTENRRARARVLAALGERLFTLSPPPLPPPEEGEEEALRIFECRTPYGEAELVAADIARRVREGASYRDFAIVARSADDYRGVLDTALARHAIPAYFSLPSDLAAFEAVKQIRAAYAILTGGGRREDVLTYLKCGLTGIPTDDCDRFELYAERWALTGRRLLHTPFRMAPGGFGAPRSEEERAARERELVALNETRLAILHPLRHLEPAKEGERTVTEHSKLLYGFLNAIEMDSKLYKKAEEYAANGDTDRADLYARLFPTIVELLDLLVELLPETPLTADGFSELLSLLFSTRTLRTIPGRADAVTVGSADLLRPNEPKHVYLIGVSRDVFPRGGEETGTFSSLEVGRLSELGIVLDGDDLVRASREYYCFLRALSAASETVTLSYYLSDFSFALAGRSEALDRILALSGDRFPIRREEAIPSLDLLFSREALLSALSRRDEPVLAEAARRVLLAEEGGEEATLRATLPLVEPHARVGEEVMGKLYGDKLSLTQSRIDRYVGCPFSYFCQYVLKLGEDTRITLTSAEVGTFIHAILEYFFRELGEESLAALTEEEIASAVKRIADGYLASLFPEGEEIAPRLAHRFYRLGKRAAEIVLELREEAAASDFRPLFFEYEPSETDETAAEPPRITLEDGTRVVLYGKIDRVDVFREGGNAYLRVVDYKTGTKTFSLDDVRRGRDLQMLIYLFALWRTDREGFSRAVGIGPEGSILPAGALYLNVSLKTQTVPSPHEEGEALCTRSGLLLNDPRALLAMEREGEGRFIPVRLDSEGIPTKGRLDSLATLEEMGRLAEEVEDTVRGIATRLRRGVADAAPLIRKQDSPCEFCAYYPVCRNAGNRREEDNKST